MNLSLKARLRWVLGLVVTLSCATLLLTLLQLRSLEERVARMTSVELETVDSLYEMEINFLGAMAELRGYLDDHAPHHLEKLKDERADFERFHEIYARVAATEREKDLSRRLASGHERLLVLETNLISAANQWRQSLATLVEVIGALDDVLDREMQINIDPASPGATVLLREAAKLEVDIQELVNSLEQAVVLEKDSGTNHVQEARAGYARARRAFLEKADQGREQFVQKLDRTFEALLDKAGLVLESQSRIRTDQGELSQLAREMDDLLDDEAQVVAHRKFQDAKDAISASVRSSYITRTLLMCILVGVSWFVLRNAVQALVQPMEKLVKATRDLATGDLTRRVDLTNAGPEFRGLGDAFNDMAGSVQVAHEQVQKLNEDLERRVRERTDDLKLANTRLREEMQALESAQTEIAAREQAAFTGRMAATVAHEVNNPLHGIRSALLVVARALPVEHPDLPFVKLIDREVGRISTIVQRLLGLYRPSREEAREFSLTTLAQDVVKLAENLGQTNAVQVRCVTPGEPCLAELPEAAVSEVLYNLVKNAIEASPSNGEVELRLEAANGNAVFTVSDQGHGIPEAIQGRVFEPFFTTKKGTDGAGLGLGLAATHSQVQAMQGRITFTSQPGRGTTFQVTLPLKLTHAENQKGTNDAQTSLRG